MYSAPVLNTNYLKKKNIHIIDESSVKSTVYVVLIWGKVDFMADHTNEQLTDCLHNFNIILSAL